MIGRSTTQWLLGFLIKREGSWFGKSQRSSRKQYNSTFIWGHEHSTLLNVTFHSWYPRFRLPVASSTIFTGSGAHRCCAIPVHGAIHQYKLFSETKHAAEKENIGFIVDGYIWFHWDKTKHACMPCSCVFCLKVRLIRRWDLRTFLNQRKEENQTDDFHGRRHWNKPCLKHRHQSLPILITYWVIDKEFFWDDEFRKIEY